MKTLLQNIRFGVRLLLKNPGIVAIAVISLGLGIGANTAIFSVINALLLRPLPYKDPDRLVMVWQFNQQKGWRQNPVSYPNYGDWEDKNQVFNGIGAFSSYDIAFNLTTRGEPERIQGALVSANFFPILGVEPIRGRVFRPDEDEPGGERVAIVSQGLWQPRFGGAPNLVGSPLALDGNSYTVVGIMPNQFKFPQSVEIWVPLAQDPIRGRSYSRGTRYLNVIARLKPGVRLDQAQANMNLIAKQQAEEYPEFNSNLGVEIIPIKEQVVGHFRLALTVLLCAAGFVLLITCANVANLLLVRGVGRQREIAVRLSLGANRARIIRQLLTESMMLAALGGAVGLAVAWWGKSLLVVHDSGLPRVEEIGIDGPVLGFTLALSLLTGLIFGLVPALQASKPNLNELLKDGGAKGGMEGSHRNRLRSLLVISEVALSLMLLISAGLMLKSFRRLTEVDPGFISDNVVTAEITLPKSKYSQDQQITRFYQQLLERVASSPGVRSAGIVTCLPLSGADSNTGFFIEGRPLPGPGETNHTYYRSVSHDYFNAMGVPLVKGRHFTAHDNHDAPKVAIINETMAQRFWPNDDPLGKRLAFDFEAMTFDTTKGAQLNIAGNAREIIGVVKDIRHSGLDGRLNPETYVPYSQLPSPAMTLVARSSASTLNAVAVMRNQVWAIDNDLPLSKVRTMDMVMSESLAEQRFRTTLLGVFALVALLLATAGVYGVISYSVTQRTREIAVRLALGAQPRDILNLVVRRGFRLLMIGIALGIAGALVINRTLSTLLFEVSSYDPVIFAGFSLVLASAALIASYIPARKATKIEPMISLKTE